MNPPKVIGRLAAVLFTTGMALCVAFAGVVIAWSLDRDVPFVMLGYTAEPAKAGESTVVRAVVQRDLSRRCSVLFSRSFFDSAGTRFELSDGAQLMNATALESYNLRSPGILAFSVHIPRDAKPGMGRAFTVLDYQCNPTHQAYPLSMVLEMSVEVLE